MLTAQAQAHAPEGLVPVASVTDGRVVVLRCSDGGEHASARLDAMLSAPPLPADDRDVVYLATDDGRIHARALTSLAPGASADLGFVANVLAVSAGPDGLLLAGGGSEGMLSARDPVDLTEIRRYPESGAVAAIVGNALRRRFTVAFADRPLAWEIAWDRDAPPVLLGYVHDYRSREAVPLPGRLTPRPFRLPSPSATLLAGPAPFELGRIDRGGRFGVVNLDVRREIERMPAAGPGASPAPAAWRAGDARGWAIVEPAGESVRIVESVPSRTRAVIPVGGEVIAIAALRPPGPAVLIVHRSGADLAVSKLHIAHDAGIDPVWRGPASFPMPPRIVHGTSGCIALLDLDGRWIAGFDSRSGDRLGVSR